MHFINLHTHEFSNFSTVLEVVNQYPREFDNNIPYFSIGIHPWRIDSNETEIELEIIEQKLQLPNCLALGECGLDKRIDTSLDVQTAVFVSQIKLAEKYNKPLIIHCVAAFQELIEIKRQHQISVPVVIHGFSKNEILAKQLLDNGFYLSFGKYLFQNPDLEFSFKSVPNDKFFLETDSSAYKIEAVYELACRFKGIDLLTLQNQINLNFQTIFKI